MARQSLNDSCHYCGCPRGAHKMSLWPFNNRKRCTYGHTKDGLWERCDCFQFEEPKPLEDEVIRETLEEMRSI